MTDSSYDVAIIGGGVTGSATIFELTNRGYRCVLLEKNQHLLAEVSSGNSGMLHTGFDALSNSIELDCIQRCQARVYDVMENLEVPINKIGATIVAWDEEQLRRFPQIMNKSNNAGISDIRQLSPSELRQREPHLREGACGALWVPGEAVTDPWLFPILLVNDARSKGAKILMNACVESCDRQSSFWRIETTRGSVTAACVINCAGLYGDIVDGFAAQNNFRIKPRKGQYTMYDKSAQTLINSSIVPLPSDVGKGVIIFRSVYDNVIVGPTAENVDSRQRAAIDNSITERLLGIARRTVKSLDTEKVVGMYVGVRPATEFKDYVLKVTGARNWITVGGIRSTGLSGSLGIGEKVRQLVETYLNIEPSKGTSSSILKPEVRFTKYGTAVIDGHEHRITHPLTFAGTQGSLSKM